jgi:hypothetical protein
MYIRYSYCADYNPNAQNICPLNNISNIIFRKQLNLINLSFTCVLQLMYQLRNY